MELVEVDHQPKLRRRLVGNGLILIADVPIQGEAAMLLEELGFEFDAVKDFKLDPLAEIEFNPVPGLLRVRTRGHPGIRRHGRNRYDHTGIHVRRNSPASFLRGIERSFSRRNSSWP